MARQNTAGRRVWPRDRRGSVHVVVMGVALMLAVMATGALTVRRVERRMTSHGSQRTVARLNALAAIEIGRLLIKQDDQWRSSYVSGTWFQNRSLAQGSCRLSGTDPADGDLTDDWLDQVVLTGRGMADDAVQQIAVTLQPRIVALDALQVAAIGSSVLFRYTDVTTDQIIASNDSATASHSHVDSKVEVVNHVWGSRFEGDVTTGAATRRLPDPVTVVGTYSASATRIAWSSLSSVGWKERALTRVVLSPSSNPFDPFSTNPDGIYAIDCHGHDLKISDCRIVGTLVLLHPGTNCEIGDRVLWSAASTNGPILVADGDLRIESRSDRTLDESDVPEVNFNPGGTPYQGTSDDDTRDSYPSEIRGLVYVAGNLTLRRSPQISGVVIAGGTLVIRGTPHLEYSSRYLEDPPPGFQRTVLDPVPGSWHQVTD